VDAGGDFDVPALRARGQHMLPRLRDTITRAHRVGVTIVAGTDSVYGPSSMTRIGQELTQFVEMGFTALEAIQSATVRNAEMLRLETSIGVLETGYEADLIAVEKNPLEDIVTIQDPLLVISNGRIALDRLNFQRATGEGSREPSKYKASHEPANDELQRTRPALRMEPRR
jgi:imidazolonepropionase-like amidohydrolase